MIADFYEMCFDCPALAVWMYAPTTTRKDIYFCDEPVPRGCTCNPVDFTNPNSPQETDEQGREIPCVEYWYDEGGYVKEELA